MELHQLRCFVAAAEQLHFGRAAQHLQMLPSALGRQIRLLEEDLGTRLFARTTRAVSLTEDGTTLLRDARAILARVEASRAICATARAQALRGGSGSARSTAPRRGCCRRCCATSAPKHPDDRGAAARGQDDPAAAEDSDRRARSRLRPSAGSRRTSGSNSVPLLQETAIVAFPQRHALAERKSITLADIADEPMLVPDRRSRPHSHDLTDQTVRAGRPDAAHRAGRRREADHHQSGGNEARRRDRAALDHADGGVRRALRAARGRSRAARSAGCRWPRPGCAARAIRPAMRCWRCWRRACAAMRGRRERL